MILLLVVLSFLPLSFAASCGGSGIPFRFEVLPSGIPILGCGSPQCFGVENGGRDILHDAKFQPGPDGEDGFFRDGDLVRSRSRYSDAPSQQADCPVSFDSQSCVNERTWVGGFLASPDGDLRLQCCHYDGLRFAEEVGRPIVHAGEVYSGGEVLRDGRQTGFDLISNIKKIEAQDGSVAYELVIVRMNCLPDPTEGLNDVSLDSSNDITRILDKVADTQGDVAQGADTYVHPPQQQPPQQNEEIVQVGEQVVPVTSGGYYYPVASGVPACFTGDTTIEMPSGKKRMDELKIGDLILTAEGNNTVFTPVLSFMHRLPDTVAFFIRVETEQSVLKLTPQHFIYKVNCNNSDINMEMIYAEDLRVGDCLYQTEDNKHIHSVRISSVSVVQERGVYAPMTKAGDLLANNIYASCHNVIKSSTLTHTFLDFASNTQKKIRSIFGGKEDGHLPSTAEFFLEIIDFIIPQTY